MKRQNFPTQLLWPIIIIVAVVVLLKPIKDALSNLFSIAGLTDSEETKQVENSILARNNDDPWSPAFYKRYGGAVYKLEYSQQLAKTIYDAFGGFNDDEDLVFGVFYSLKTKAQLSQLAETFQRMYGADLQTWLRGGNWPQDRLSDAELNQILKFAKTLK